MIPPLDLKFQVELNKYQLPLLTGSGPGSKQQPPGSGSQLMRTCRPGQRMDKSNNSQKSELEPLFTSLVLEERSCRNENNKVAESPFLLPTPFDSDIFQGKGQI